jgi:hypothetical protein
MVTNLLFAFRGSNDCMSPGESLLQHVLDDPLLALARADGEPVCYVRCYIRLSLMIYRSKFSSFARRSLDGTALG